MRSELTRARLHGSIANMPQKNITIRQAQTVAAIRNHRHVHGLNPSLCELAQVLGIAKGSVQQRIVSLEKRGVIRRHPLKHRSLEIIEIIENHSLKGPGHAQ